MNNAKNKEKEDKLPYKTLINFLTKNGIQPIQCVQKVVLYLPGILTMLKLHAKTTSYAIILTKLSLKIYPFHLFSEVIF